MRGARSTWNWDICDSLSFTWSSWILLIFVLFVGVLRFVFLQSALQCLVPMEFTDPMTSFAHAACWDSNRGFLPLSYVDASTEPIPLYHNTIPVVLLLLLLGFQIPRAFKLITDVFLGTPTTLVAGNTSPVEAERLTDIVQESLDRSSMTRTFTFLLTRLLICLNLLIQFIFVSAYFKDSVETKTEEKFNDTIGEMENTTVSIISPIFPKSIMCDYKVRSLSNIKHYSVTCQMSINTAYEQFIYIFWVWLLAVGIFSGFGLLSQLTSLTLPPFVKLRFRGIIPEKQLQNRGFAIDDALLYLLDIENTYGKIMAREVASKLRSAPRSSLPQTDDNIPMSPVQAIDESADTSIAPLMDSSHHEKSNIV